MDDMREQIAYLQGLAEGLKLDEGQDEARIIKQVIDVIADLADEIEELRVAVEDIEDYMECLDEDLFEEVEDLDDTGEIEAAGDDEEFFCCTCDDDIDYVEVECPQCHDIICFESDIVDDEDVIEVTCPNCNKVVFVNDGSMPLPEGLKRKDEEDGDGDDII